ncbi:MAG: ATP-dependent DNA helicase RecG [Thermoguttaceae bacterium]|jgi:ATP-dependent DNA helicase RecG|nr:ATP-dependent DNA helicase RecG [Thermoguttaceae bacterium]
MSDRPKSPAEILATPVQFLRGVGPARAELLQRLGLHTLSDVLFNFPRDYEDLTDRREIADLEEGKLQTVVGVVEEFELRNTGPGRSVLGVLVRSGSGWLRAVWFNQPYMAERFYRGQRLMLSGKPKREGLMWEMAHPRLALLADDEEAPRGELLPVYALTEGLAQWHMRRIVRDALEAHVDLLDEVFPAEYLDAHRLLPIRQALPEIHFPKDHESLARARRRFVYQELFILQLALAVKRHQQVALRRAPVLETTAKIDARIRRLIPFTLTASQERAVAEIAADLARPTPMNRLLQADVGMGKTIVAVYAMLVAVAHGYQVAMMAPTEILARQHFQTIERLLRASQVRRALLVGGLPAKERADLVRRIASGEVDLVVGTQAIIQEDVEFARLGLVVIDEQHRFGVRQRASLKQAGLDPHYLVMTATPIPRTVTMTLFGDLDVSTLRDAPPGRQKVYTYLVPEPKREAWWEFFGKKLREGRQGFVVTPLVEDSEQLEAASLEAAYEALANGPLEAFRLGLIHGRMTSAEKDATMAAFRSGEIQVLVSTSVIEVGVDVPNATLMTIEGGEWFGLAQLHQLRGRISRGKFPGYCGVFADPQTDEAKQRLDAFASTTDGFQLAEIDFALRGPGELFGTRQHGMPPMRIADLLRDTAELDEARRDAAELVASDPGLARPEHARLRRMVIARYGRALDLADVG